MGLNSEATPLSNGRFESRKKKPIGFIIAIVILVIISLVLLGLTLYFALRENEVKTEVITEKEGPCVAALEVKPENDKTGALKKMEGETEKVPCFTKDCVLTASRLLSAMDESVNPCENFFEFACNNFIRNHPVPEKVISTSTFIQYHDLLNLQQKILIENYDSYNKTPVLMKAQEVYHVCLNTSYQKRKEIDSFKSFINDELGGWPLAEGPSWKQKYQLEDLLTKLMKLHLETELFEIDLMEHPENPTIYLFKLKIRSLDVFVSRDEIFITSEKMDTLKRDFFFKILEMFGNNSKSSIYNDLTQMERFEKELERIMSDTSGDRVALLTYKELYELTNKSIDWFKILRKAFGEKLVKDDDTLVVLFPKQFKRLATLLKRYSDKRALINRIITSNIFLQLLPVLGPDMDKDNIEIMKKIGYTIPNRSGKSQRCLEFVSEVFPAVITRMFVETHVDKDTKTEADKVVQNILKAYKEQIVNSKWVDKQTKDNALEKVKKMKRFIEYPDFTFNDKELEEHYSQIPDIHSSHFMNYVNMNPVKEWMKMEVMLFPRSSKQWPVHPMDINAVYLPPYNAMYFPVGILQLPFFDVHRPSLVNYAIGGSVVGHELGHAFDNNGKNYDADGVYRNWWTKNTEREFENKSTCFIKQYSNFCPEDLVGGPDDPEICVNGEHTLGENLADNTGVKAAFEGYKMYRKEKGEEEPLPGLEKYTPEQLFFISYAYTWCENIPPENWLQSYEDDEHSPGKYRVLGTLSNSEDFREAFKCEKKSLMNRAEATCTVW
uniref:Neprilysin n=1 Tax=Scolopendra viridis TaxID=118503 RepID=A0A4D5RA01_SCOVI